MDTTRKRRRPPLSCVQCRQRKIKCDRKTPCTQCVRARSDLTCSYSPSFAPESGEFDGARSQSRDITIPTPSSSASVNSNSATNRPDSRQTNANNADISPVSRSSIYLGSHPDLSAKQAKENRQQLKTRVHELEQQLSEGSVELSDSERIKALEQAVQNLTKDFERPKRSLTENVGVRIHAEDVWGHHSNARASPPLPRLHVTPKKTKFFPQSHWLYTIDQFQFISWLKTNDGSEVQDDPRAAEVMSLLLKCRGLRKQIQSRQSVENLTLVPHIRDTIPSVDICDELLKLYFQTFELFFRIIHVPSFCQELDQYLEQSDKAPRSFIMKLILMLAIGSTFYRDENHFDQIRSMTPQWIYTVQWWLSGPSEKSSMTFEGLQIRCLLFIARHVCGLPGSSTWTSPGSLLGVAYNLGLHRDPKYFSGLSFYQAEMRRRLWTTIMELVVLTSLDSATPQLFAPSDYDCSPPSNLNDDDFDEDTLTAPPYKPSSIYTQTSVQIQLHKSFPTRLAVLNSINNIHNGFTYDQVLEIGEQLNSLCRDNIQFFDSSPQENNYGLTDFHPKFMDMTIRRYIISLFRPFMIKARKDPTFYFSRRVGVESALVILSYVGDLRLHTEVRSDFSRLTSLAASGGFKSALCLDALIALGLEAIVQLEESVTRFADRPYNVQQAVREARAMLIVTLEYIQAQLETLIIRGVASMKKYIFVCALLGQIDAMENGESPREAVIEAVKAGFEGCSRYLLDHLSKLDGMDPASVQSDSSTDPTDFSSLQDFDFLEPLTDMDLTDSWLFADWDMDNEKI